jgi:acetyl esterase/lipase
METTTRTRDSLAARSADQSERLLFDLRRLALLTLVLLSIHLPTHAQAVARIRGTPVSITALTHMTQADVRDYLAAFELDAASVRYGVDAHRVVYRTIDATGKWTVASSLLAVPRRTDREVKLVAWLHGTTLFKGDAASVSESSEDRAAALLFAAAGFVTTAPDYLGLGTGPGTHPYDDRPSEVTASIDALRATRTLAEWLGGRVDPRVAISGFSQGGASSLALARALQDDSDASLKLGALAPIAGPYDMSGTLAAALRGNVANTPAYLAYLTVAWNRLHYLYESPSAAFLPPYDRTIEALFDNTHAPEEVLPALPQTLDALFTPEFLESLTHPTGVLRDALDVGDDVCRFRPQVSTTLYAASGDRDVPIENAYGCQRAITARGGAVELVDFGEADHAQTLRRALPRVLEQFGASG